MIVHVDNLVKRYGDLLALDHLNMDVEEGEILGLLGPNGSGKTTAINCILALLQYDKGNISLFDQPMAPDAYDLKRRIGVVLQNVAVFEELTVYENIDYFCSLYIKAQAKRKQLVEEALNFVELQEFRKYRPSKLSGGLLRRLNIACGIAHKPDLLIMDEPTVAVDPQSRNAILEGIKKLNARGTTIIYTSHYMEEVEHLCTRIIVLDKGKQIAKGTKEQLTDMIALKEKITVEQIHITAQQIAQLKQIENLYECNYQGETLETKFTGGNHNLLHLMETLQKEEIAFGKVYSEKPTLNDVFLEITGKELRD